MRRRRFFMKAIFPTYLIKQHAKKGMKSKFSTAFLITFIPAVIVSVLAALVISFLPGSENTVTILLSGNAEAMESVIYNFTMAVSAFGALFGFLNIGSIGATLDMIRGKSVKIRDLFKYYDKWYVAAAYPFCTFLYTCIMDAITAIAPASGVLNMVVSALVFLLEIAFFVLQWKLMFFEFVLADSDCANIKEAFKKAWKMSGVHTWVNSWILSVSFFLWFLLSALTGGIALIYVYPYVMFASAALYDLNVIHTQKKTQENAEDVTDDITEE